MINRNELASKIAHLRSIKSFSGLSVMIRSVLTDAAELIQEIETREAVAEAARKATEAAKRHGVKRHPRIAAIRQAAG